MTIDSYLELRESQATEVLEEQDGILTEVVYLFKPERLELFRRLWRTQYVLSQQYEALLQQKIGIVKRRETEVRLGIVRGNI